MTAMVIDSQNGVNSVSTGSTRNKASPSDVAPSAGSNNHSVNESSGSEEVVLSQEAKSLSQLEASIKAAEDVDRDRVAAIKQAIAEGNFEINAERIAERMLQEDNQLG